MELNKHMYMWLAEQVNGPMIHESPDGGKTVRSRPSSEHPVQLLAKGTIPIDIWYKIFKGKHDY